MVPAIWVVTGLSFVAAGVVRGWPAKPVSVPEDVEPERPRIQAPMQFLSRGAGERVGELDRWVSDDALAIWKASRGIAFALPGCPRLKAWLESTEGLRIERLLDQLRRGTREDALAALTLIFQLARTCEWDPGLRARTQDAERLASLLQTWLRVWGDRAAADPVLHEPALAASLVYGRVMRIAWTAPMVGYDAAAYARATSFLDELCGLGQRQRTPFGQALQARYGRAFGLLERPEDRLAGLSDEAAIQFPDVDGDCD
jgi:hypothetical protein